MKKGSRVGTSEFNSKVSSSTGGVVYDGPSGRTRGETIHVGCECGVTFVAEVHRSIDVVANPELLDAFFDGELDCTECPSCGQTHLPNLVRYFHDSQQKLFVMALPESLRHRELELTAKLLVALDKEGANIPVYVKRPRVAYGDQSLRRILREEAAERAVAQVNQEQAAPAASIEQDLARPERELADERESLNRLRDTLLDQQRALEEQRKGVEIERKQAVAAWLSIRERSPLHDGSAHNDSSYSRIIHAEDDALPVIGRPQHDIDLWRTGDKSVGAFAGNGKLILTAKVDSPFGEFIEHAPRVLMQLHEVNGFPLITLVVLPRIPRREPSTQHRTRAVYWSFDIRGDSDNNLLQLLRRKFSIELDLYDEESRPVATWELQRPLDGNVRGIMAKAVATLQASEAEDMGFDSICEAFADFSDQALTVAEPPFSGDMFMQLPAPSVAKLALDVISYWSQPARQEELLWRRSFPIAQWDALRRRVLQQAVAYGLCFEESLVEFVVSRMGLGSRRNLLQIQLRHFGQTCDAGCVLNPVDEWQNWQILAQRCDEEDVSFDDDAERLMDQSALQMARFGVSSAVPRYENLGSRYRPFAATSELDATDILAQLDIDEDDDADETAIDADEDTVDRKTPDRAQHYGPTPREQEHAQAVEVTDDDIIERSNDRQS